MSTNEPANVATFKTWLLENGASIHPEVIFEPGMLHACAWVR